MTYKYNADGLRVQKVAGGVTTDYTLFGKMITHMKKGNDQLHFYYDTHSRPAMVKYGSAYYTYLYNLQGDVIAILDANKTQVVEYKYDAWGRKLTTTGSMAATLGALNPFRYRGYVYDEETELYYLNQRYYSPSLCRFIICDDENGQVGCIHAHNPYTYCGNNPVFRLDSSGNFWLAVAAAAAGALIGGITQVMTNVATGKELTDGLAGAMVGGAVYNAVSITTGNTAVASYASAGAESITNEAVSYILGEKEFNANNIIESFGQVGSDTLINGSIYLATGKMSEVLHPINKGWFRPKKIKSCFTGKYARHVYKQTAIQGVANFGGNIIKSDVTRAVGNVSVSRVSAWRYPVALQM